jgi:Flp pilus assembly protein TadG
VRRLRTALSRRWARVSAARDRGGVAILVTVVLGGGVLLGAAAVVIDVGQLYAEREQLQSGADSAAMAVAQNCIRNPATCGNQNGAALTYANGNAKDGTSAVTAVCGRATGLPTCPAPAGTRADCMGGPPAAGNYAEVRTATRMADGSTLLPPTFAASLLGNDSYRGKQLAACARVAWGPPRSATGLAVTLSTCDWNQMTGGRAGYWPRGTVPPVSAEGILYLHSSGEANTCAAGPSGWDAPGGFGWLDEPNDNCMATVSASGTFDGNTGLSASATCKAVLQDLYATHRPVLLPIYDGVRGQGSNTVYHLAGFASFVMTGYYLPGISMPSWLSGRRLCSGSDKCLYGYFTTAILPQVGDFGTVDYGTNILKVVG